MTYIFGYGGFAREVCTFIDLFYNHISFVIDDKYYTTDTSAGGSKIIKRSDWDPTTGHTVIAIGEPAIRKSIVESLKDTGVRYCRSYLKGSLTGLGNTCGEGSVFCPGAVLTTNITVGDHCHFNLNSTVGHDTVIGDFVTVSPGANISGNCSIGSCVYIGTNAAIREKIKVCDNVTIGMGSVVVKDITEPGVYVGIPVKKIK